MQCIDEFHTGTHLWLMKEWMHTARSWSFAIKRKRNGLIWIPTLGKQAGCWWRAAGVAGSEKQKEDAQRRRCYGRCCAAGGRWTHAVERWCWSCAVMSKWLNECISRFSTAEKQKIQNSVFFWHVFWGGAARVPLRGQLALRCALPLWFRARARAHQTTLLLLRRVGLFFLHAADVLVHDQRWAL